MAEATLNEGVVLTLTRNEAAALLALLARVGVATNEMIADLTYEVFTVLDNARTEATFWPDDFQDFEDGDGCLIDPEDNPED